MAPRDEPRKKQGTDFDDTLIFWMLSAPQRSLRVRGRISSQICGVEAPVRQGTTTKDWHRQFEEEKRSRAGWIGGANPGSYFYASPKNDRFVLLPGTAVGALMCDKHLTFNALRYTIQL